jgi:hypothetical protein
VEIIAGASNTKIYVDGALNGTSAVCNVSLPAVGNVTVGAQIQNDGTGFQFYSGSIGYVAMFDSSFASLSATDHYQATLGWAGETAGPRISRMLAWHGYTGTTSIATGTTALSAVNTEGVTPLQACLDAANGDDGIFYISGDGFPKFRARTDRYAQSSVVTLNTSTLPVETAQLVFEYDRQHMANELNATRPNSQTVIRVFDQSSIDQHRKRNPNLGSTTSFPVSTDAELRARASWFLLMYSQPRLRVGSIRLRPFIASGLAPWACTLEPFDRITVSNLPANAPATSMDFLVESKGHPQIDNGEWVTELSLSPWVAVFVPGDATYGVPGSIYPVPY